jgi:hypothetical protein
VSERGWIGVDLDRTLAYYDNWEGPLHIGAPIPLMLNRVKAWLADGVDVRIFTARVSTDGSNARNFEVQQCRAAIDDWCIVHLGRKLPITCSKDYDTLEIWDDRAVQVVPNLGERVDGCL